LHANLLLLQIWDIGGQSITSKMVGKYITGANAVLLCYDITSTETFENLSDWLGVVKTAVAARTAKTGVPVPFPLLALVGNKTDISHMRTVKMARHQAFTAEHGGIGFLCSAKTGDQVNQAFFRIAADLAGVTLTRPDVQVQGKTITAHIVNHKQDDPHIVAPEKPKPSGPRCTVM
jgi:Ras-related protein Rab-28